MSNQISDCCAAPTRVSGPNRFGEYHNVCECCNTPCVLICDHEWSNVKSDSDGNVTWSYRECRLCEEQVAADTATEYQHD